MRNTFAVKFYCRKSQLRKDGKAPVEISVIVCGKREMWQLPLKCEPEKFKSDRNVQQFCTSVENKINQIYSNCVINSEAISAWKIKDIYLNGNEHKSYTLKNMFDDGLKVKSSDNCEIGTYNKYARVIGRFYEATGHNENNEASAVTYKDILTFKIYIEKIHQPQTVFKEMRHLKFFFNLAFHSGKIKANPFGAMQIKSTEKEKPFLTNEELRKIIDLRITSDRLDKVRDVFVFMAGTGLEWADITALQKEDVKENDSKQMYIKKPRVKTGVVYTTVLTKDAREIWEIYDGELPLCSPQKFNTYIKEIVKAAGIDKEVTSLTARHTFACYLLNERKLSYEIVAKMLGHQTTKETIHYARMLDNSVFEANARAERTERAATPPSSSKAEIRADLDELDMFKNIIGIE